MKHLSILVPDAQINLSTIACIVGAVQMIEEANAYFQKQGKEVVFKIHLLGAAKESRLTREAFVIQHSGVISETEKTDLILIPSTLIRAYEQATESNQQLIRWVEKQFKLGAEVASMCSGGFMLAATGILSGKSCSTHWALANDFRKIYPDVSLQIDQLITDEKGIYTNGGAYSFLNLLLYLVEKFYDRATAIHCTKYFQIELDRNLQSEFSIFNGQKKHADEAILNAQKHIESHFSSRISIEKLSAQLNIGRRNFDRRFIKATGFTPLDYLQRVRIESAKKLFESTRKTVNEIMFEVGYTDSKAFRDVFSRVTGLTPLAYKSRYNK